MNEFLSNSPVRVSNFTFKKKIKNQILKILNIVTLQKFYEHTQ